MDLPPLPRWLSLGSRGRDVRALQRALRRAGHRPRALPLTNVFDADVDAELRAFQTARGLEVDGVLGPLAYAALGEFYDARGRWLVSQVPAVEREPAGVPPADASARQRIVQAARLGYERRDEIGYTQNPKKRMDGVRRQVRPPAVPRWEDCSSFATWCYFAAGAPDPNGSNYDGFGFTGTQIEHGAKTSDPRPGDLCFYGPSPNQITHVALYVGNGRMVSHGNESGPSLHEGINYRGSKDLQQCRSYLP